ncbi:MAG: hypothetical protein ACE5E7_03215 [Anaerolineae bacterium]
MLISTLLLFRLTAATHVDAAQSGMGYGFNVAAADTTLIQSIGFDWMKVFAGPGTRLPLNILVRIDANASHMGNLTAFGDSVSQLAQSQGAFIEAYEIGNEPNLDATYGWGYGSTNVPPNAADYAALLCTAYARIKAIDPTAVVVSAGLAPTGRVSGNWQGHPGHNGLYQDEREFLKEFFAAGGGNCLDGVGYHPYGFSADFDAPPDIWSADPAHNCTNGFCFRGAEKIYALMQTYGLGSKTVWATEFGWITQPPSHCLSDPGWQGRQWQIVSEQKQADNLAGAYQYAAANWPWMEAMFVFNLNFNTVGWYPECEQMRFYGIEGRPAETALRNMPKSIVSPAGELTVAPDSIAVMIAANQQPFNQTIPVTLGNIGSEPITYTVTAVPGSLSLSVLNGSGTLNPAGTAVASVFISSNGASTGTYTSTLSVTATPGTLNAPRSISVKLFIVNQVHRTYLPQISR